MGQPFCHTPRSTSKHLLLTLVNSLCTERASCLSTELPDDSGQIQKVMQHPQLGLFLLLLRSQWHLSDTSPIGASNEVMLTQRSTAVGKWEDYPEDPLQIRTRTYTSFKDDPATSPRTPPVTRASERETHCRTALCGPDPC